MSTGYVRFAEHLVRHKNEDGDEQELAIIFEFGADQDFEVDGDAILTLRTGRARFELLGEPHSVRASGEDHVQLLYRLMSICGSELLRAAKDAGLEVYQYEPGDAEKALDFFK